MEQIINSYFNVTSTLLSNGNPLLTINNPYTVPLNISSLTTNNQAFRPPERSTSFYLLDYWKIAPNLLIEMGVFKDIAKSSRVGFATPIYNNKWSGRLGINYQVNDENIRSAWPCKNTSIPTFYLSRPLWYHRRWPAFPGRST